VLVAGRASQLHDQRTYAANRRQFAAWTKAGDEVEVIARTLDYKLGHPRENGIDVQIAVDLVCTTLLEGHHEVAMLMSADTDLLPALELITQREGAAAIEVATWEGPYWAPQPLKIRGKAIRQHKLTRAAYDRLADTTDYRT
jgi:uncharacterized LabA/DUF88 family protein